MGVLYWYHAAGLEDRVVRVLLAAAIGAQVVWTIARAYVGASRRELRAHETKGGPGADAVPLAGLNRRIQPEQKNNTFGGTNGY